MAPKGTPLVNCHIVLCGEFGSQNTHINIKRWVVAQGGHLATSVSSKTTHLVCTKGRWENDHRTVKEALKHKNIDIVSYDWLDDSLRKRSCKRTGPYLWQKLSKKCKKSAKLGSIEPVPQGKPEAPKGASKLSEQDVISEEYHPFRDSTGVVYSVTLSRANAVDDRLETCHLDLHEHDTVSLNQYACIWTTASVGKEPITCIRAPPGSNFALAFTIFRQIFKRRTGIAWERALERKKDENRETEGNGACEEGPLEGEDDQNYYTYALEESADKTTKKKAKGN